MLGRLAIGALVLACAACGDDENLGARADAAPDAAIADAAPPDADERPLPDLVVDRDRLASDLTLEVRDFAADACELDPAEDCIGGPGTRTVLRFAVETPNIGNADLEMGMPTADNPLFEYSACHGHYHFKGYASYQLLDDGGNPVAIGHKQAFCLEDSHRYLSDDDTVSTQVRFWCGSQGIQRGWSDVYHTKLGCQLVDVTDTPPGTYTLRVELNGARGIEELRYDNNVVEIPVTLGDPGLETSTEACDESLSSHALDQLRRECGWAPSETFDCVPGALYRVGCSECAGLGSCTGDPMLRVCDPATAGSNCSYPASIGDSDDLCNACPRTREITCPPSGKLAVYTAAQQLGTSYTCTLALEP